jgi:hypothetical protein
MQPTRISCLVHHYIIVSETNDVTLEFCALETKHFIYFYVGSLAILIWKS